MTVKRSNGQEETVSVKPKESQGSYFLGVSPALKTGLKDKIFGGFQMAWEGAFKINLGIFNLIPIPALDGGKIVMNIIEAIRRKPLNQEIESYITLAGVAIMVVLMIAVTWNDIMRAFF